MSGAKANIRRATPEEWDGIWKGCDYATYFHSREWAELWRTYTDGRMEPHGILFEFEDKSRALLPLSKERQFGGLLDGYHSSPAGTFGGWISDVVPSKEQTGLMVRYLLKTISNLTWRLNPYQPGPVELTEPLIHDKTQVLFLAGGFDRVYKSWSKGHRAAARQASKSGVTTRLASNPADWELYYAVYEDSMHRWGERCTWSYGWKFFRAMSDLNSGAIRLWLAEYEGRIVAGAVCFYAAKHAVYWHGASLQQFFNVRPSNLLMYEAIRDACTRGFSWFDFNPSGGLEGVKSFKKGFGAQDLSAPVVQTSSLRTRLIRNAVRVAGFLR
jgi:hypothetical protein